MGERWFGEGIICFFSYFFSLKGELDRIYYLEFVFFWFYYKGLYLDGENR